jgi:hypothetical protein
MGGMVQVFRLLHESLFSLHRPQDDGRGGPQKRESFPIALLWPPVVTLPWWNSDRTGGRGVWERSILYSVVEGLKNAEDGLSFCRAGGTHTYQLQLLMPAHPIHTWPKGGSCYTCLIG